MRLGIQRKDEWNQEMLVTRTGVLERLGEGRKGWKAPHAPAEKSFAPPAGLPVPDLAGLPPARARAKPGIRGRWFRSRYCAGGETRSPWRHTTAAHSLIGPGLTERTVVGRRVSSAYRHHSLAP